MAGKGSAPRPVDRRKWDNALYWARLEERKKRKKKVDRSGTHQALYSHDKNKQ